MEKAMLPTWIESPNPSIFLSNNYLVLDVENTIIEDTKDGSPLNPSNRLLLSCFKTAESNTQSIWGSECYIQPLIDRIRDVDFIVCHNAKHELQWLRRAGAKLESILAYDTMIGEYVILGNRNGSLGLGAVSEKYGYGSKEPYVDMCMKAGICPSKLPRSMLEARCKYDIRVTEQVFLDQRQILYETDRLKTHFTRCILTPVLADIEFNGMYLDKRRVDEAYTSYVRRYEDIGRELEKLAGGINLRSSQQRATLLYDTLGFDELTDRRNNPLRTGAGGRKSDADTINKLKARTKEQRRFHELWGEYNRAASYISKNLEFFKGVVEEKGGIMQAVFNQTVTATHRLSSSGRRTKFELFDKPKGAQFQNLPREFKPLFGARHEGWSFSEIDGAQLEFRVAAQLGRDEQALQDIIDGFDIHRFSASVLNTCSEDKVTKAQRQEAKADTFKPLYGGQSGTKAQMKYYDEFKKRYSGVASWQEGNKYSVLTSKQLTMPSGMIFYWPDTALMKDGYITNSTQICNYPVQSFATADIIPIGLTKLWHEMKARELQSFIVNTVHDSALTEQHPDEHEVLAEISSEAFTTYVYNYLDTVYDYKFFVPLAAGLTVGSHWSEGEEVVYNSTPPYTITEAV